MSAVSFEVWILVMDVILVAEVEAEAACFRFGGEPHFLVFKRSLPTDLLWQFMIEYTHCTFPLARTLRHRIQFKFRTPLLPDYSRKSTTLEQTREIIACLPKAFFSMAFFRFVHTSPRTSSVYTTHTNLQTPMLFPHLHQLFNGNCDIQADSKLKRW